MFSIKFVWMFIVTSIFVNVVNFWAYINYPGYDVVIFHEGHLMENLSAGLCFSVFLFGVYLLRYPNNDEGFPRTGVMFFSALGLFGFLEEISYGVTLSDTMHHTRVIGVKLSGVHDLVGLGLKIAEDYGIVGTSLVLLFVLASGVFIFKALFKYRDKIREVASIKKYHPVYLLMAFFIVLVFSSAVFDQKIIMSPTGNNTPIEELIEFNAALVLLFSLIGIFQINKPKKPAL